MENVLGWASSLWDDEYRFNYTWFKHSDFTVLTVGWNPNAKATESFQCNFTHFFTKLMNSVKFNRYEFGEYTLVDSDLVTFE